jgi:sulfate/thiosulfate transport system ATP-binding protein
MSIEVRNIRKTFGAFAALKDVSVHFPAGQLVALLGPSGSGKTSLLRIIAGLEAPDSGSVLFDGEDATRRRAKDRRVGFVFQHYALFRHMSVYENVAFGLRVRPRQLRPSRTEIERRVMDLLKLVQLDWLADRRPSQLSGGQRQRVALARALAVEPKVLLLDEPFGALDAKVRKELRRWLRRLHDEIHVTSIFVTHDVEEAIEVCDRVVVMNEGRVEQMGTPDEVYEQPASPFVYDFLGSANVFPTRVHEGRAVIGPVELEAPAHAHVQDRPGTGYARPHDIEIVRESDGAALLAATVIAVHAVGPVVRVELLRTDTGGQIDAELSREQQKRLDLRPGEDVFVRPRQLKVFMDDYAI